jgi:hypothetical protein
MHWYNFERITWRGAQWVGYRFLKALEGLRSSILNFSHYRWCLRSFPSQMACEKWLGEGKKTTRKEAEDDLPVGGAAYRTPRKLVTPSSRLRSDWYVAYPKLTTFNGVDGAARAKWMCWLAIATIEKNRDNTAIICGFWQKVTAT